MKTLVICLFSLNNRALFKNMPTNAILYLIFYKTLWTKNKTKKNCYTVKINHEVEKGWWVLYLKNSLLQVFVFKNSFENFPDLKAFSLH